MWTNFEIILEECYPGKGKKKGGLRILTSELSGEKVGDIEYHNLSYEKSGNYRITKIVDVAADRKRAKKKREIEQARAQVKTQEIKRLNQLKAAFAANDFEFMLDAFENGWSISQARAEYEKPSDERSQPQQVAKPTKAMSEETKRLGAERQRFKVLMSTFDFDQAFALEAWEKGWTVEKAADEYYAPQEQTQKVTRTLACEDSSRGDQRDFISVGKELAQAEGITLGEALKRVARMQPELHQAYKESCCGQSRADYGQGV